MNQAKASRHTIHSAAVGSKEAQVHYLSTSTTLSFENAVSATKEALQHQRFAVLAEIDLSTALRTTADSSLVPYLILCACNPDLTCRAIRADHEIGSIILCNVVVHQQLDGSVRISVADPAATVETINDVELVWVARELRSRLDDAMRDIAEAQNHQPPQARLPHRAHPKQEAIVAS
jgi:uncharacterized protein (DUF302 family)